MQQCNQGCWSTLQGCHGEPCFNPKSTCFDFGVRDVLSFRQHYATSRLVSRVTKYWVIKYIYIHRGGAIDKKGMSLLVKFSLSHLILDFYDHNYSAIKKENKAEIVCGHVTHEFGQLGPFLWRLEMILPKALVTLSFILKSGQPCNLRRRFQSTRSMDWEYCW
jgi:hypothetical protein